MSDLPAIRVGIPTQVVTGKVTIEEYIVSLAKHFVDFSIGYRVDYDDMRKLIDYAEKNHKELNK